MHNAVEQKLLFSRKLILVPSMFLVTWNVKYKTRCPQEMSSVSSTDEKVDTHTCFSSWAAVKASLGHTGQPLACHHWHILCESSHLGPAED